MKRSIFFICLFFLLVNISTAAQTKENKFKMYFDKVGETSFYFYDLATKAEVDELSFELYEKDKFQYKANFGVHAEVYENGSLSADLVFSSFNVIDDQDGNMLTSDTPAAGSGTTYPVLNYSATSYADNESNTVINSLVLNKEERASTALSLDRRTLKLVDSEVITEGQGNSIKDYRVELTLDAPVNMVEDAEGNKTEAQYLMDGYYQGYVILRLSTT